jgi:Domain of unknown function (DUF4383)
MSGRTPAQSLSLLLGAAFLAVGILGFIPGITTHYGDMSFAGEDSGAELLGVFQISILHNLVHILLGIAGLVLSKTWDGARMFLIGGGVIYLGLWLLGIAGGADWVPVDSADNWLHFVLGLTLLGGGLVTGRLRPAAAT